MILPFWFAICNRMGIKCRITMLFFGCDDEASEDSRYSRGLCRINPHRDDENVLLGQTTAVQVSD